jgi:hypothetical protein
MKTQIELEQNEADFLKTLQNELRQQDEAFTRTPLYCVYERESAESPDDGAGWPVSLFLTEDVAEKFIARFSYRLRHPYIYVRSPGEASELHSLHLILKESAGLGNGPFVEDES